MNIFDTIVARITPEGEGAVSVIRLSGDKSFLCLKNLTGKVKFTPRKAMLVKIKLPSEISDKAVAICYPKNHSYTGEDVCELSLHGNDYLVEKAIQACVEMGARTAQRGEFTLRAFLNGKMDLTQAESVLSLIKCSNEKALKRAGLSSEGKTGQKVRKAIGMVDFCRAELEVCALEDTSNPCLTNAFLEKMSETEKDLGELLSWSQAGKRDLHKPQVFIIGPPNAGKSTLFNRLFGSKRVVVSEIPGTTRDMIREDIVLQKGIVRLFDGAGFRDGNADELETMGRELYLEKFDDADLFILLLDASSDSEKEIQRYIEMTKGKKRIIALNKSDLTGNPAF
ncbi:50S ribosome-binding GTPase, partial [candidate division WOR-3 bacterium]|nr:50S ribosome-binding GTPase [candidate division WOR-3 bacterium]